MSFIFWYCKIEVLSSGFITIPYLGAEALQKQILELKVGLKVNMET